MKLSLGFSPCPNDTTEGLEFEVHLGDVEELNQGAFNNVLDITKLSYHAFAYAMKDYALLHSGSALGNNCGPLLIAKKALTKEEVNQAHIAIPGKYTTANFLLRLAFPAAKNKSALLFSAIEDAVLEGQVDAGLIIHENRFTYEAKGLVKIIDLGSFWEYQFKVPIPLGGIVVKRSLPIAVQQKVDRVLRRSVEYARQHPAQAMSYVAQYAQEMNPVVMKQHIDLYVNEYTEDLGTKGKAAIDQLFQTAVDLGLLEDAGLDIFVHN